MATFVNQRLRLFNQGITSFLALAVSMMCLALCLASDTPAAGAGGLMWALYPFCHAGFLHAALNVLAFLCVCFLYKPSPWWLVAAYMAAVAAPDAILLTSDGEYTLGLSGVVYFLFGSIAFKVKNRLRYQQWMAFFILLGFALPKVNGLLHLYSYILGLGIAAITTPLINRHHATVPRSSAPSSAGSSATHAPTTSETDA